MSTAANDAPARATNVTSLPTTEYREFSTSSSTTSSTSSSTSRARARTREERAVKLVYEYWSQATGIYLAPIIKEELKLYVLDPRIGVEGVTYAIDETTAAPRPSWAYCRAILLRMNEDRF
jgi:DNA replication protein DnaD